MLQIVDIAFNNFSGKLPGKFFGTWKRNVTHNKDEAGPKFIEKKYLLYTNVYYQDSASVTVINKGQEMELVKILTIFTSIDLSSSNHFEGPIPDDLMDLKILHIFNLSNNDLSGEIPSSINNLKQLESLDLSQNSLSGSSEKMSHVYVGNLDSGVTERDLEDEFHVFGVIRRTWEAYDGDIAFASALETFGGGHNDPISVALGGMLPFYINIMMVDERFSVPPGS
ncbi:hypothetical protein JHK85_006552 [Glycine max]|nr:hypothetical protein JHK85_006552 [Glycine max]